MDLPSFETLDSFWDLSGGIPNTTNDRRRRRSFDPENEGPLLASTRHRDSYQHHHHHHHHHRPHHYGYSQTAPSGHHYVSKKRRVDDGPHGQVFREVLPLRLMQCDGGVFRRKDVTSSFAGLSNRRQYGPENVLKSDDSVYCSKKSTCNMIFRHESGRPFTIEKLVIKAPGMDYTSP